MYPSDLSINFFYTHYTQTGPYNVQNATEDITGSIYLPIRIFKLKTGFRFAGQHAQLDGYTLSKINFDFSSRIWKFNFRINYRNAFSQTKNLTVFTEHSLTTSLTYTIARTPGVPIFVRGTFIRGQSLFDIKSGKFIQGDLQLSRTLFRNARLNINLGYNFQQKLFGTEVGFSFDMNILRSTTTFNSVGNATALRQSLNGSIGVDSRSAKIELSNREQVGRAALSVVSYIDNNNSGIYDKDDEILPYNSVILDNPVTARVGRDSVLRLSQLQSYYRYNLKVNRNALADPTLVPLMGEFSFVTDPNQYKRIEIPFYRGGIIDGTVSIERPAGLQGQGGLRLLIKGVSNKYEQTVRTFSDGGFYAMDIPPGIYTLEIDQAQLGFLGVSKPPAALQFEIKASAQGDYIEGQKIVLVPDPENPEGK
jgi:hypothetical protein